MAADTMRAIRYDKFGEPADVLRLEEAAIPSPKPGHISVRVEACGLNPADWALCRGLSARQLPSGIGLDVSGIVTAVSDGDVSGVSVGEAVYGPAAFMDYPTAGAADFAILSFWEKRPEGLSPVEAAALPMVVETAARYLDWADVKEGQTVLINGAGTMVGFAAVQMAILRGARVIATAGETFAASLRAMGAIVTAHGEGMVGRVRALGKAPDIIIDAAPANLQSHSTSTLTDLVQIADGDTTRVITIADQAGAEKTGVRTGAENMKSEGGFRLRWNMLGHYGRLAAEKRFSIPVARTFDLADWREALDASLSGRARGKLVLLPRA